MPINNRQSEIVKFIRENNRASVKKLSSHFFISEMTVRRDLKELEIQGYIRRYHGGAVYAHDYENLPIETRRLLHQAEKKLLSERTKKYLKDFSTVFIDSSSTSLFVVPLLSGFKDITVVTNSIQCLIAASKYHLNCVLTGGNYYEHDMCTVGSATNAFLRDINVDLGFFSSRGLDDDGVISDTDEHQTSVRKAIMPNCKKKIFLFDNTKQHKKFLYTVCTAEDVDDIIII